MHGKVLILVKVFLKYSNNKFEGGLKVKVPISKTEWNGGVLT